MGWVRKNIGIIFLTVIIYFAYFFTHLSSVTHSTIAVLGVNNNLQLFTQPQDGRQPILNAIKNAQKSIDLEIYLLSDKEIISSLILAKVKGITEKIILEQHPFGGGISNQKTRQMLLNAGIDVHWASSSFALTHEKMLIIDNIFLFILNQNFSASSFSKNREFNIVDANLQDIMESQSQFLADWNNNQFVPTDPHLLISPDTSRSGIMQLINNSKKAIDIEIEVINDTSLINAFLEKAKTARIRIILPDFAKIPENKDSAIKLQKGGVFVRTKHTPYIHAKLMILDLEKAYIGSINFSTESLDQNREIGIVVSEPDILNKLGQDFESDWNNSELVVK